MLLSRFWYVLLAVAAVAGTGAALLAQAVINARVDESLAENLAHDRVVVEAMLRLEARSRLDRIAFITVDSKLGGLLRQAAGASDEKLRELSGPTKELMRAHVARIVDAAGDEGGAEKRAELEPDIAFALDNDGRIVAQLGPLEANPPGASLATFPLVKRALQGYLRDDVLAYDRRIYRVAARPVMSGTEYAGVIVHGYRLDKGLTEKLAKNLGGATLAFVNGNEVLGSHVPSDVTGAPQPAELASALAKLQGDKAQPNGGAGLIELQGGGRAVFMPVAGSAGATGVGYAIARPRKLIHSPEELFQQASSNDVQSLPLPALGGAAFVLALIGLLSIYFESDRHMKRLLQKTAEIGSERDRLIITEWRGAYRKLADKINQAIDKEVEKAAERGPSARKKANLDELLGHTPEATATPFFGFANEGADAAPAKTESPAPKAAPAPAPAPKPAPVAAAPAAAAAAAATPRARPNSQPLAAGPMSIPAMALTSVAPSPPPPAPAPAAAAAARMPAPPPLKAPAAAPSAAAHTDDGGGDFDEGAHFREVYKQYLETRQKCGEPVDNLTFEKFGVTLRKTRDQIVEKHGARAVRFTVQVKEGKAALKAQPIKR